jgi:hypothetical protein
VSAAPAIPPAACLSGIRCQSPSRIDGAPCDTVPPPALPSPQAASAPPAVTTGFSHDLLLLCAAGDREGMERLASRLRNAGQRVAVEVMVEDFAPAVALADGLAQAAVVVLTLSERFQQEWSSEDIAALHQAEKTGRWLVLQLDGQEIPESWPAGVGFIPWSPDDHGNSKRSRQALARIQALLDPSMPQPATEDTPADRRRKASDDFSSDVNRALYSRVGGYCSCPSCPNTTSGPHSDAAKATNTGVAAHISAAAPGGPRYNPSLTSEQRASAENGIWLCQICAKLIDKLKKKLTTYRRVLKACEASGMCESLNQTEALPLMIFPQGLVGSLPAEGTGHP